ncbi:MAG: DUF4340 domain-containing protein [Opitutae bacterium]
MRIARSTLILFIANLVVFGLVWRASITHTVAPVSQNLLFPTGITGLEITDNGTKIALEKKGSFWYVNSPYKWAANLWSVQRIIDELRFIDSEKGFSVNEVKSNGSSLETYGLEKARWTLKTITENNQTQEIKIGENKETHRLFILTPDSQKIIPVSDALAAAIEAKPETYRVDKVFEIAEFEIRAISTRLKINNADVVTNFSYEERARPGRRGQGAEWRFTAPFETLADPERITQALSNLVNIRVLQFAEKMSDDMGLAEPVIRIALEGSSRRQVLLIGKPGVKSTTQCWAKLEESDAVFLIETKDLGGWYNPRAILTSTRPVDFDPEIVTGFNLSSGGRTITLHRLESTGKDTRWEIPVVPGSTAIQRRDGDSQLIKEFLADLSQLRAINLRQGEKNLSETWLIPAANLPAEPLHKVEIEIGGEKLTVSFYPGPENKPAGTYLVHQKGAAFAGVCEVSLLRNAYQNVAPQFWRNRVINELATGTKVVGLRIVERKDGKVIGEARLGPDGNWAGTGRLDAATSRRLASTLTQVKATEFPTRDIGAGEWKYLLRITDQAAAGSTGASETLRNYWCTEPLNNTAVLLRDENDDDSFLLDPTLAEILIPLLNNTSR